ncbi:MAG TPA: DUF4297 domain-containing protein [Terriglobales bacterium]|nr:DUF4297 domain-containing protein [Terriglobales bacterium]
MDVLASLPHRLVYMSLRELLIHQMPRDTSGALASDRFEYQHNWALCRLLELHQTDADYVMTFDHHEDVTVLDSEEEPDTIQGFQIKTKSSGNWTIAALTKQSPGKTGNLPSILRKLCELVRQFPDHVTLLQVVSNAPLSVSLEDGTKGVTAKNIRFEQIEQKSRQVMLDALVNEFAPDNPPSISKIFEFHVSDLSLEDHVTHAKGKLNAAMEALFPGTNYPLSPAYRALMSEITARNNNREQCDTYADFLSKKSISRSRFDEILQTCGIAADEPNWSLVYSRLNTESIPFGTVRQLQNAWNDALLDRFYKRDAVHLRFWEYVSAAAEKVKGESKLAEAMDVALAEVKQRLRSEWAYSEIYIKACILIYLYEH